MLLAPPNLPIMYLKPINTVSMGICPWYELGLVPKVITFHFPLEASAFASANRETLVKSFP